LPGRYAIRRENPASLADRIPSCVSIDSTVNLIRTGNDDADAVANTALFTEIIEDYVRRNPDQWLWAHRRSKTRPEGQPPLY
jgi:lauroyl/myristoyl acyltransferase